MENKSSPTVYVPHNIKAPIVGSPEGVLSGLSIAVKDMFDIARERVGGGSPTWLETHPPASRNAALVDQLLAAGGTIVGKTICDEFFYSVTGTSAHYGTPINPRSPSRVPGGSSSGSASAASAGACDIAIGSDTGGSVRVPAALCGVYGIRVSRNRVDMRGAMSMAPSFDAAGWFAASPGPFSMAGRVLLKDYDSHAPQAARIAIATDLFEVADNRVASFLIRSVQQIGQVLPALVETTVAGQEIDRWREALRIVQAYEVWKSFGALIEQHRPELGPGIAERMRFASSVTDEEERSSRNVLDEVTNRLEAATADGTILVLPTCPSIAPHLNSSAEELEKFRVEVMRLVCSASISGLPQVTVPIGTLDGAPVGLSFIGWRNGDEALLQLARRVAPHVGMAA